MSGSSIVVISLVDPSSKSVWSAPKSPWTGYPLQFLPLCCSLLCTGQIPVPGYSHRADQSLGAEGPLTPTLHNTQVRVWKQDMRVISFLQLGVCPHLELLLVLAASP